MNHFSSAGALEIEVSGDTDRRDILLRGDLDLESAHELRSVLHACAAEGTRLVMIDLAELDFLAIAGLHVFIDAHYTLDGLGARLALTRPPRHARRILQLTGSDTVLAVDTDRPQALHGAETGEVVATVPRTA